MAAVCAHGAAELCMVGSTWGAYTAPKCCAASGTGAQQLYPESCNGRQLNQQETGRQLAASLFTFSFLKHPLKFISSWNT